MPVNVQVKDVQTEGGGIRKEGRRRKDVPYSTTQDQYV
jgi:hypothetical protein